jgi:hypothetical protein
MRTRQRALLFFAILIVPAAAGAQTQVGVTAWVSQSCSTLGSTPCYSTIQACVSALVASNPDDGRNCIIMPGLYQETVSSTLTTGATNLIGFGTSHDSHIPVPVRIRPLVEDGDGIATVELSSGTVQDIAIYRGNGPGDVALRVPIGAAPFVKLRDVMMWRYPKTQAEEEDPLFDDDATRMAEILHTSGVVNLDDVTFEFVEFPANTDGSVLYVNSGGETLVGEVFIQSLGLGTNSAAVEVAGGHLMVTFSDVWCSNYTSCFEVDEKDAALDVRMTVVGGNGRLMRVNNDPAGGGSTVNFRGVQHAGPASFTKLSIWDSVVPKGDVHQTFNTTPTSQCFPGWTAVNTSGGAGTTFYGCEGTPAAWVAK